MKAAVRDSTQKPADKEYLWMDYETINLLAGVLGQWEMHRSLSFFAEIKSWKRDEEVEVHEGRGRGNSELRKLRTSG